MMDNWTVTRKGSADIYRKLGVGDAIVDRRGFGAASAMGHRITFRGIAYPSIDAAKLAEAGTCPCCAQPATELRAVSYGGWAPDEHVCRDCFYEYRDVEDETEFGDLPVVMVQHAQQ